MKKTCVYAEIDICWKAKKRKAGELNANITLEIVIEMKKTKFLLW